VDNLQAVEGGHPTGNPEYDRQALARRKPGRTGAVSEGVEEGAAGDVFSHNCVRITRGKAQEREKEEVVTVREDADFSAEIYQVLALQLLEQEPLYRDFAARLVVNRVKDLAETASANCLADLEIRNPHGVLGNVGKNLLRSAVVFFVAHLNSEETDTARAVRIQGNPNPAAFNYETDWQKALFKFELRGLLSNPITPLPRPAAINMRFGTTIQEFCRHLYLFIIINAELLGDTSVARRNSFVKKGNARLSL
jgi:hypothetical protein